MKTHPRKIVLFLVCSFSCFSSLLEGSHSSGKVKKTKTKTPIKHLVIIVPENSSFDHLFGSYPEAANPCGEPRFKAKNKTPTINGISRPVIKHNTNLAAPFRLDRSQAVTNKVAHHYTQLQEDADGGLMDMFVQVNNGDLTCMGYFDGNTVTALWNYAQRFSISDNFYSTTMTPSTPGHINLISGQTHGAIPENLVLDDGEIVVVDGTLIGDPDPAFDRCSEQPTVEMTGRNVGDLLNEHGVTWGWFQGGFRDCSLSHMGSKGFEIRDYSPHHQPFQYYRSTSNPDHLPPSKAKMIGYQDQANHQYDLEDFWAAVDIRRMPSVSFLKPSQYQDGHPTYSSPLLLQTFLVETINKLQKTPEWKHMAIMIVWDDSGGWYDHVMPPIINQSHTPADALLGPGDAGNPPPGAYQGRLAYGNRVPFLLISPYAKRNYVDHAITDQTSVLRFIEKNWCLGKIGDQSFDSVAGSLSPFFCFKKPCFRPLFLNPETGLKK